MSDRIGLTPAYRCRELDRPSCSVRQTVTYLLAAATARTTFRRASYGHRQISEMMDAFYTGLSRHALLSSVADENMNPAVTSFCCCCCDVMLTKHTYSQSALITSRRQQSSIDPSIFCREFVERQTTNAFSRANMKPLMKGYPYSSQIQQAMAIRTIVVLCWCVVLSCCHLSVVVYLRGKMIVYRSYTTARQ